MNYHYWSCEVSGDDFVDVILVKFLCTPKEAVTCIVHYDINTAMLGKRVLNELVNRRNVRNVKYFAVESVRISRNEVLYVFVDPYCPYYFVAAFEKLFRHVPAETRTYTSNQPCTQYYFASSFILFSQSGHVSNDL